jgi:hypothetical protein
VTAALLHRSEAARVQAGAEGPSFSGQYHCTQAFLVAKSLRRIYQGVEHRSVQRIQLVRARQSNIGDAVCDHDRDALLHDNSP